MIKVKGDLNLMVNVYAANIEEFDSEFFKTNYKKISLKRQQKVVKYKNTDDKKRAILAELLLITSLNLNGVKLKPGSLNQIQFNEFDKPHLTGIRKQFNISHSGKYVVSAVSDCDVGVDVQKFEQKDIENLSRNFFSQNEHSDIIKTPPYKRTALFYDIWTAKESYLKNKGTGLNTNLNSFSIKIKNRCAYIENDRRYFFKYYDINPNYSLCVCSKTNDFCGSVWFINPANIEIY